MGTLKRVGEILLACLITVLVLELSFQFYYYFTNHSFLFRRVYTPIYVQDPDSCYRVKPNLTFHHTTPEFQVVYYTNQEGIRTSAARPSYEHDQDKYRVLLIGPSFAFGWGVNYQDSFGYLLEKILNQAHFTGDRQVEVINLGVPGMSLPYQFALLKKESRRHKPDLVVQLVYGGMMVGEAGHFKVANGLIIDEDAGWRRRLMAEAKNSGIVFYSWILYNRLDSLLSHDNADYKVTGIGRDLSKFVAFDPNNPQVQHSLAYYRELNVAASQQAKFLAVYCPVSYDIHKEDISRWRHRGYNDINSEIAANQEFCNYLNQHGIKAVDLSDAFLARAKATQHRLYYWLDLHWTPEGNELAAENVAQFLLRAKGDFVPPVAAASKQ